MGDRVPETGGCGNGPVGAGFCGGTSSSLTTRFLRRVGELEELPLAELEELSATVSEYPDNWPNELVADIVAEGGAVSLSSPSVDSTVEKRSCIHETSDVSDALRESGNEFARVASGLLGPERGRVGEVSFGNGGDCAT